MLSLCSSPSKCYPYVCCLHEILVPNILQERKFSHHGNRGFLGDSMVKNLPARAGDTRDLGSILWVERSQETKMATHSSILAWKIPWTEGPGGLQSMGLQRVRHNWACKLTLSHGTISNQRAKKQGADWSRAQMNVKTK